MNCAKIALKSMFVIAVVSEVEHSEVQDSDMSQPNTDEIKATRYKHRRCLRKQMKGAECSHCPRRPPHC